MIKYTIGDCRNYLEGLPHIDLICTDPPFNFSTHGQGMMRRRDYLIEIQNSFGSDFNPLEYLDLLFDVVKPFNAYFFTNKSSVPVYLNWAEDKILSFDILTWIKPNPTPLKNNHYLPDTEYIIYIKSEGVYFDSSLDFSYYRKWILVDSPNQHKTVINHPSPKPISVVKKLIMVSCPQGGTVLDPFLGSGTTLRACRESHRNGIGFEINPKYEPEIKKRIAEKQGLEKFMEEGS